MDIHELVEGDNKVASLPEIYYELQEVMNDPESVFNDFAYIIRNDTGLSARLLGIVNSAFFGFPARIETISHAISIVGMDQLNDLALSTIVMSHFKDIPKELIDMNVFWEHSVACGLGARIIAFHQNVPNPERFFVAGMLHDIGRLVLLMWAPDQAREAMELSASNSLSLHLAERETLGFDHANVGGLLLKAWRLPETHQTTTTFHHSPLDAPFSRFETAAVHMADIIANTLQLGGDQERVSFASLEKVLDEIQLSEDMLSSVIINSVLTQHEQMAQAFL
ncbi:MAG: HDOD domain-containing protein [Nitrospinales bacterium]